MFFARTHARFFNFGAFRRRAWDIPAASHLSRLRDHARICAQPAPVPLVVLSRLH
jgi:hypothetical protein